MIHKSITIEINKEYFEYMQNGKGDLDTRSEVVMVLPRPGSKVLTLTKSFYPSGTYNLPSGGIHPGETTAEAFLREVAEETGLQVALHSQIGRIDHILGFAGRPGRRILFTSHVMLGTISSQTPHSTDDNESISAYYDANIDDLRRFAENMRALTGKWLGFGRFRAGALDFVIDCLANSPALLR